MDFFFSANTLADFGINKSMKKIVINSYYGGFGLSHEAVLRYAELSGIKLFPDSEFFRSIYYKVPREEYEAAVKNCLTECGNYKDIDEKDLILSPTRIPRDDAKLIQVIEEMGEKANDGFSKLKIVEIPDDVKWEINDYDGMEWVAEVHRRWD